MGRAKTIYDEIRRAQASPPGFRLYVPFVLAVLVPLAFLGAFRLICHDRTTVNWIIWNITTPVKHAVARACSRMPFNVAEIIWTLGVLFVVVLVGRSLFLVLRSLFHKLQGYPARPLRRLLRRSLAILSAGLIIYSGYTAMWGINYYGDTFSQRSGLQGRKTTTAELAALTAAFADKCNELSDQVPRNGNGLYVGDLEALFQRSHGQYQVLYDEFPCLDLDECPARPMFYSRLMSYLNFTGFYFPFTGESLVNVDAPYCLVPVTILHELAHQRNVAMEDEANFLAIVVGLHTDDTEFQYSSALMGYIHLSNALFSADRDAWRQISAGLNKAVRQDLNANNTYWAQFKTPAGDAAEAVYSSFARSYEQEDIMKSYGACVDLLAAYYLPKE